MQGSTGYVLVVDDHESNRSILYQQLIVMGHQVDLASNGQEALDMLRRREYDLLLLDIMMPVMDGFAVLSKVKASPSLRHIPVIVISARDDMQSVVNCIELGAEDYLHKPFNIVLLKARIDASLEKKRLHDLQQEYLKQLEAEKERSERLLLNILPGPIAQQLKEGHQVIADYFSEATVLFADIVNFTPLSARLHPDELIALLNDIFSGFDRLAEQHALEKIKTIGDAYMVVGGLPRPRPDHAEAVVEMALAMQQQIAHFQRDDGRPFEMRIGIATGPVVAGVIGTRKFAYDLWGDTVNTASRMESHGLPGQIQVTQETYERLSGRYQFELRGTVELKGQGRTTAYLLIGHQTATQKSQHAPT
jgi:adenylate cyclase